MATGGSRAGPGGRANGRTYSRLELQNTAVMEELYRIHLPEELVRANGLGSKLEREPATTAGAGVELSEEERQTAAEAADRITRVIARTPGITVERTVRDFKSENGVWDVTADNVESEFREVERRTFSDGVHWGRVIAFLAFSVSFAAYVSSRGIHGGAYSVFNWTTRVLNDNLAEFIRRENGWRGLITYADTLLRAQDRQQREEVDHTAHRPQQRGVWDAVAGIGVIGVGTLLALGMRQAFS